MQICTHYYSRSYRCLQGYILTTVICSLYVLDYSKDVVKEVLCMLWYMYNCYMHKGCYCSLLSNREVSHLGKESHCTS